MHELEASNVSNASNSLIRNFCCEPATRCVQAKHTPSTVFKLYPKFLKTRPVESFFLTAKGAKLRLSSNLLLHDVIIPRVTVILLPVNFVPQLSPVNTPYPSNVINGHTFCPSISVQFKPSADMHSLCGPRAQASYGLSFVVGSSQYSMPVRPIS